MNGLYLYIVICLKYVVSVKKGEFLMKIIFNAPHWNTPCELHMKNNRVFFIFFACMLESATIDYYKLK